jgi:lysophospholipase L1-like esterase
MPELESGGAVQRPGEFNPWKRRSWTAMGTSITQFPAYAQPLASMLGATLTNLGVGGGTISVSATSAPGSIHARIANIPADADLVTFEVGMADFRTNAELGRLYDTTLDTFHGAIFRCIVDTLSAGPRRTLAFLTPYGIGSNKFTGRWDHPNDRGDRLEDFVKAIREVCAWCGIAVINSGQEAGIGGPSAAAYLLDGVHLNPAGGLRLAEYLYDRLIALRPHPQLAASSHAGAGQWTLHPVTASQLSGTGISIDDHEDDDAAAQAISFTPAGTHFYSVLWLAHDGDNAVEFQSVPSVNNSLWIVHGAGPAGWVGVGDFGDMGAQRLATFEAHDSTVAFGSLVKVPHGTDPNATGTCWRVARVGTVVHIWQQRAEDGLWMQVAHPLDLTAEDVDADYYRKIRLGILTSHGSARAIQAGSYVEDRAGLSGTEAPAPDADALRR